MRDIVRYLRGKRDRDREIEIFIDRYRCRERERDTLINTVVDTV